MHLGQSGSPAAPLLPRPLKTGLQYDLETLPGRGPHCPTIHSQQVGSSKDGHGGLRGHRPPTSPPCLLPSRTLPTIQILLSTRHLYSNHPFILHNWELASLDNFADGQRGSQARTGPRSHQPLLAPLRHAGWEGPALGR